MRKVNAFPVDGQRLRQKAIKKLLKMLWKADTTLFEVSPSDLDPNHIVEGNACVSDGQSLRRKADQEAVQQVSEDYTTLVEESV